MNEYNTMHSFKKEYFFFNLRIFCLISFSEIFLLNFFGKI